jgi:outer membrane protein assembly factor BamB
VINCAAGRRLLLPLFGLVLLPAGVWAENWPQWRGPDGDGISTENKLPAEWDAGKNVAWKLPLPGMSGATPVVWNDRIFLTSEDGSDVVLLCVSTEGKQLWKSKLASGRARFRNDEGNQASPSPSTDGRHVYAFAGTGDLACFDLDGREVWRFNTQDRYGKFRVFHGLHVTPLLHGDRLYLSLLHSGGWWVLAFDKATGKEVWKVRRESDARSENEHSYASPVLWRGGKDAYLVVHGCDYTTAHRLEDGSEIWRLGDLNPKKSYHPTLRFVASPVAVPDLVVVPTAKGGPVVAVKPDAKGSVTAGSPFEQWRLPRGTPDVSSPLVHSGLVYLCRETGVLVVLDAKTGQEKSQQRLHAARYRASPLYADGKVYCTARDGTITVLKAGAKPEVLAVNKLPDQLAASPVVSGGRLYLRGFEALYAISEGGK